MKEQMTKTFQLLAMVATVALLANCSSPSKQNDRKAATPAQAAVGNLNNDRNVFVNQTQARIDEMTKFAQELRVKAGTAPRPQAKKMTNSADDLDSLVNDVRTSLTDVRTAAPENWVDNKRDVEKYLNRAESAYSNDVKMLQ